MPPPTERKASWNYDLTGATQSRRTSRVALKQPYCWELTGVDGTTEGMVRPFQGFREVHRFDVSGWGGNHDSTSRVLEAKAVDFVVGEGGFAYGFVYRVSRSTLSASPLCDIFIDYYNSKTGAWVRSEALVTGTGKPPQVDPENGVQMSVQAVGRGVYVFVEGQEPVYFTTGRTTPWAPVIRTNTGPGKQCKLISPADAGAMGSITSSPDDERPGYGQVILNNWSPESLSSASGSDEFDGTWPGVDDFRVLAPGDYAFAYVLYNSETGLHTGLSEVAQARKGDFPGTVGAWFPAYAYMEIFYDTELYDQAYIYRSVRVQDAGGTYIASVLHLDKIIDLADWWTVNNPVATPDSNYAQAVYVYSLEDKQLVFQDTFTDRASYDDNIPKGGCAHWYENTMLVSNIPLGNASTPEENRPFDSTGGVGEIRWSTLTDPSPELFPPTNRYTPRIPSNTIIAFQPAGANVVGFSQDRMYHIRKEAIYLKAQEIHEGFGIVNSWASETVGSIIYFVSPKGLKAVYTDAQLDDVASINRVILEDWASTLQTVSLAFDATMSTLFVLNGDGDSESEGEAYVFWFNTGSVTRLRDLPLTFCFRCPWPVNFVYDLEDLEDHEGANNDDYLGPTGEVALFVQNAPRDTTETISGFSPRLLMVDRKRELTQVTGSNTGERTQRLLPVSGDSIFAVGANFSAGTTLTLTVSGKDLSDDLWGARLYVLKAQDETLIGKSAKIKSRPSSSTVTLGANQASELYGLVVGDVVGISPIPYRVVTWPAGGEPEEMQGNDFLRVRHFDSVGCFFSGVGGSASGTADEIDRFRALVYRGDEEEVLVIAETRNNSGALERSLTENESIYWAAFGPDPDGEFSSRTGVDGSVLTPGVEVVCPDLDYSLVSIQVTGAWKGTNRSRRPS